MKVHKMLERQINVYVPTFMYILLLQASHKAKIRKTISILSLTEKTLTL